MVMIMEGAIVFVCSSGPSKYLLAFIAALVIFINEVVQAQERSIPKSEAPGPVLVLSNSDTSPGVGFASFSIVSMARVSESIMMYTGGRPATLGLRVQTQWYLNTGTN